MRKGLHYNAKPVEPASCPAWQLKIGPLVNRGEIRPSHRSREAFGSALPDKGDGMGKPLAAAGLSGSSRKSGSCP